MRMGLYAVPSPHGRVIANTDQYVAVLAEHGLANCGDAFVMCQYRDPVTNEGRFYVHDTNTRPEGTCPKLLFNFHVK